MRMHVTGNVRQRIEAGHRDFVNEIRVCSVLFVGLPSLQVCLPLDTNALPENHSWNLHIYCSLSFDDVYFRALTHKLYLLKTALHILELCSTLYHLHTNPLQIEIVVPRY